MTQTTVNLSAAQALTDPQAAAAYRVLVANARNQPNHPVALSVQTAANAVTTLGLATTAQLSAAPATAPVAPAPVAPDPLVAAVAHVAAQQQIRVLAENEHQLAEAARTRQEKTRREKVRADARALGLTLRDEDHR